MRKWMLVKYMVVIISQYMEINICKYLNINICKYLHNICKPSLLYTFSSVQSLSRVWLSVTPWLQHTRPPCPSPTPRACSNSCPSSQWCLCCPLLLLPSTFPSIRVFSNESVLCIRWPKYWSFSLSISPSNEHPGLISFGMDWLDLLAVQGTL